MEDKVQSPALIVRIIKYAVVLSAFLFIYIAIKIPVQPHTPLSQTVELVIAFAGLTSILIGFLVPRFVFRAPESTYQRNPALPPFKRWMTKCIMSLGYFEACILFGLVLHFLGARPWLVELLFGAGIAAELIWSPGPPPGAEEGQSAQR